MTMRKAGDKTLFKEQQACGIPQAQRRNGPRVRSLKCAAALPELSRMGGIQSAGLAYAETVGLHGLESSTRHACHLYIGCVSRRRRIS